MKKVFSLPCFGRAPPCLGPWFIMFWRHPRPYWQSYTGRHEPTLGNSDFWRLQDARVSKHCQTSRTPVSKYILQTHQKIISVFLFLMFNPFLMVRLFSDHDYLVSAAGRLGLEAGQGLLDGDIVDNLSSGLETARGAYNFLADLSWSNIMTSVKLVKFWTIKYLVSMRTYPWPEHLF